MPSEESCGHLCTKPCNNMAANISPEASPATIANVVGWVMAKQSANDSALGRGVVEEVEHHRHVGGRLGLLLDD